MKDIMDAQAIAALAVEALEDIKGKDIINLDTQKLTDLFQRMVVCTGIPTARSRHWPTACTSS